MHEGQGRANGPPRMSQRYTRGLFVLIVALAACGQKAPIHPVRIRANDDPAPMPTRIVEPVVAPVPNATTSASVASPASEPTSEPTAVPAQDKPDPSLSGPVFPPPSFVPPHARSAQPGDGVYTVWEEGAAAGTGALARTTVHPHPFRKDPMVVVLAVDLRRVELVPMAGTEEPTSTTVPPEKRPGLVPIADQSTLIAVFNGGFLTKHGQFGMRVEGDDFGAAREDSCSIAFLDDGSLRIATHRTLIPLNARLRSYRQTPPCLVEAGTPDARLVHEDTARLWGAALGGKREIRRTALGLDASGKTLFFGIGEWVWARDVALAMKSAGAVDVAELDINWSYTRFLLYDRSSPPKVVSTLIEKVQYTKDGYLSKPAPRDFFYLRRRGRP